jgi:hypothetical protein
MAKAPKQFQLVAYSVDRTGDRTKLLITGKRTGRPTKRFTLATTALRISSMTVTNTRKNKMFTHVIKRINYLPKAGETRLHSDSLLYPGDYEMTLTLQTEPKEFESLLRSLNELFS